MFKQALEIRRKVFGEEHKDVAESLNGLAGVYLDQVHFFFGL